MRDVICVKRILTVANGALIFFAGCGARDSGRLGERMAPSVVNGDAVIQQQSPDGDSTGIGDALPAGGDEDAEYKKLLKSCGGIDPAFPERLVLDQQLRAIPARQVGTETIVLVPVNYKVDFDGTLTIKSAISGNDIARTLNLINAQPSIAANMARDRLAAKSGPLRTDYLGYSDRAGLSDIDPVWNGITCTIQPGTRTINQVGPRVVAVYDKPIPIHLSPISDRERYDLELAHPRHFELKATITESANPKLKVGQIIDGFVDIERVTPSVSVTKPNGSVVAVSSDTGVRIRIKFQTDEITNMLGLTPETIYLVDHTTHLFHSITADLKDGESPLVTFITPEAMP